MKILIVEDDPMHSDRFEMLADQLGYDVAAVCDNAFDALGYFHSTQPDLLLLDIHLKGETDGVQLAEKIVQIRPVPIVFVSSMDDDNTFARAQRTQPVAFIIKPFSTLQLQRAIELAVGSIAIKAVDEKPTFEQNDMVLSDCFFVKVREKLEKVPFDEILYIESDGHYSMLHTTTGRKFAVRMPLNEMEQKVPAKHFARTHRSFLIQMKWLQSIDTQNMVVMLKDKIVPLSKGYKDQVLGRLEQI